MQAPHVGRCEEDQDHGVALVIVPFRRSARKLNYCLGCDAPLIVTWHRLCGRCYAGSRLYSAITRYREALQ